MAANLYRSSSPLPASPLLLWELVVTDRTRADHVGSAYQSIKLTDRSRPTGVTEEI